MAGLPVRTGLAGRLVVILFAAVFAQPGTASATQPDETLDPPAISEVYAFDILPTSVQVTWSVDRPVTGQVEYGVTEDYGQFSVLEPSFNWSSHVQHITDLEPGTEYHYRVISRDEEGQEVRSGDQVFSTISLEMPTPGMPAVRGTFGSAINTDSLANSFIGGPRDQRVAYRFEATESASLESVRVYVVGAKRKGYGAGTGGTVQIAVQADDGTPSHHPSGKVLAQVTVRRPTGGPGNLYPFRSPPKLRAGNVYHVVFRNVDPKPRRNYLSINGLYMYDTQRPWQPGTSDLAWAQLTKTDGGKWTAFRGRGEGTITPIMALQYDNGATAGLGYMEVWSASPQAITKGQAVRQRFYVSASDRLVSAVSIRLSRQMGRNALLVRLETSDGDLIASGRIPASRFARHGPRSAGGASWATLRFQKSVTLEAGNRYHLVLSTKGDSRYSIFSVREGTAYGYPPSTYFALGGAEVDDGSGWRPFDPRWGGPIDESDLQFFFD